MFLKLVTLTNTIHYYNNTMKVVDLVSVTNVIHYNHNVVKSLDAVSYKQIPFIIITM